MPARPLSPQELEEVDNLVAECDFPHRLREVCAELIRLREFANFAHRYRARLPLKVQDAYVKSIIPRAAVHDLLEISHEEAIELELHQPPPVRHPRTW